MPFRAISMKFCEMHCGVNTIECFSCGVARCIRSGCQRQQNWDWRIYLERSEFEFSLPRIARYSLVPVTIVHWHSIYSLYVDVWL